MTDSQGQSVLGVSYSSLLGNTTCHSSSMPYMSCHTTKYFVYSTVHVNIYYYYVEAGRG